LQEAYLQRRRKVAQVQRQKQTVHETIKPKDEEVTSAGSDRYCSGLDDFQSVLTAFTRYRYAALCLLKGVKRIIYNLQPITPIILPVCGRHGVLSGMIQFFLLPFAVGHY